MKMKYRILPAGAADGMVPFHLIFIDKKDVDDAGLTYLEACQKIADEYKDTCGAVDIIDLNAVTVSSDGIMGDAAVVAFASIDHGKINKDFGFINVSEIPYYQGIVKDEPHMTQWNSKYYAGKRLYRGPSTEDRGYRNVHNENMTMTGRIANNNTGSEMMNLVEMSEILVPCFGMNQIMRNGDLLIGRAGAEVSVGIGMVVREQRGRIFQWSYGAGKTAHNSGEYARTVKSDFPAVAAPKSVHAEYTLRALECGLVPGQELGCSPVVLSIAKAGGFPIAFDKIEDRAWIELESVGIHKADLEKPSTPMSREEIIAKADEILPGLPEAKLYKHSEVVEIREIEF